MALNPDASGADAALLRQAAAASSHAYAPYSRYAVGAAVRCGDGRTFVGVNVENGAYGLTLCAERGAIAAAAAAGVRPGAIVAVAVAARAHAAAAPGARGAAPMPCGACRQVLVEWGTPATTVTVQALPHGAVTHHLLAALLPHAFTLSAAAPEPHL